MSSVARFRHLIARFGNLTELATLISNRIKQLVFFAGPGLFLGISAIDHSCAPNAVYISHGKNLIVRAIDDKIEQFDNVRLSYYRNLRHATEVRRQSLLSSHYFLCQCSNCLDEEKDQMRSSLICKNCQNCVPAITGICKNCKTQVCEKVFASSLSHFQAGFLSKLFESCGY